jgi:arylsulfatase
VTGRAGDRAGEAGAVATAERPNLLFVLTDQQRADALGSVSPWMKTPNLDRLVREGTLFGRCVTQSPGCIPARVSLMTGLYPHNTAVWHGREYTLPATARTWIRAIHDAGYRTSVIGKLHVHPQGEDVRAGSDLVRAWGFDDVLETAGPRSSASSRSEMTDEWECAGVWDAFVADMAGRAGEDRDVVRPSPLGFEHHYDSFVGRRAVETIREFEPDRPWFCWVGFGGPHEPWDAPEPYFGLYDPAKLPRPLSAITARSPERPEGLLLDARLASDAERLSRLGPGGVAAIRANYAGKVSLIDHWVGELLAAVEERGDLERTVIVFASDHGEMNGDHGLFHKSCFLDPAVTVPLVIRVPGNASAARPASVLHPVELVDVGPTLADAAGAELRYEQWGRSLWPVLAGERPTIREVAMSAQRGEVMVVGERFKVALNRGGEAYLCTDLENDPDEQVNLAGTELARDAEEHARALVLAWLLETQLFDEWF